jgi:methyl-accepting chemotaxis protein
MGRIMKTDTESNTKAPSIRFTFILVLSLGVIIFTAVFIFMAYTNGQNTLNRAIFFLVCGFILFMAVLYILLAQYVLSPLELLVRDIGKNAASGRLDEKKFSASREFQILAFTINEALDNLHKSARSFNSYMGDSGRKEP